MKTAISNTESVIDSREVIDRIEELEDELGSAHEAQFEEAVDTYQEWVKEPYGDTQPAEPPEIDDWIASVAADPEHELNDEAVELGHLRNLASELEGYGDWRHGDQLVREDYFTDFISELIKDCYEMPKEMESGAWPWSSLSMDWEGAAEEAKSDYTEASFDGVTYLMRA